jgi:hypothetical protein
MVGTFMQIDDREFKAALLRFYASQKKSWPEVIKSQARLIAVNLSYQTQPFGDGQGRAMGENAIRRDINYIFKPLNDRSLAFFQEVLGGRQIRLQLKRKDGTVWITDMDEYMSRGQMGSFHQSQRTASRGNVGNANKKNKTRDIGRHDNHPRGVVSQGDFQSYLNKTMKKVGIAKGGWAACAKILGGTRGISQWVTRHAGKKAGGSVMDRTSQKNPYVIMTNMVPWIDKCLNTGQMQRALDIQKDKMIRATEIMMSKQAKAMGF